MDKHLGAPLQYTHTHTNLNMWPYRSCGTVQVILDLCRAPPFNHILQTGSLLSSWRRKCSNAALWLAGKITSLLPQMSEWLGLDRKPHRQTIMNSPLVLSNVLSVYNLVEGSLMLNRWLSQLLTSTLIGQCAAHNVIHYKSPRKSLRRSESKRILLMLLDLSLWKLPHTQNRSIQRYMSLQ